MPPCAHENKSMNKVWKIRERERKKKERERERERDRQTDRQGKGNNTFETN